MSKVQVEISYQNGLRTIRVNGRELENLNVIVDKPIPDWFLPIGGRASWKGLKREIEEQSYSGEKARYEYIFIGPLKNRLEFEECARKYELGGVVEEAAMESVRKKLLQQYLDIAERCQNNGDYDDAVKAYYVAAEDYQSSTAQRMLGALYAQSSSMEDAVKWYWKAANQGDAESQLQLGICYALGKGVPESSETAVEWFEKAAKQGNVEAQYRLGLQYTSGEGIPKDLKKAFQLFKAAADQGCAAAQERLADFYENPKQAFEWYYKAANQGRAEAQFKVGDCYWSGSGADENDIEAVRWFEKAAQQGHARAAYFLGCIYYLGEGGILADKAKAAEWFRKSADCGDAEAQWMLGDCYREGEGVEKDAGRALMWYHKAAEQGDPKIQFDLGEFYYLGDSKNGIPDNKEEMVKWYTKAAEQGYAEAQMKLGEVYNLGLCGDFNHELALKWYERAAEQGNTDAKAELGKIYYRWSDIPNAKKWFLAAAEQDSVKGYIGLAECNRIKDEQAGIQPDETEALKWYLKAEKKGNRQAIFNLGWYYETGCGNVKKNKEAALKCYNRVLENSSKYDADIEYVLEPYERQQELQKQWAKRTGVYVGIFDPRIEAKERIEKLKKGTGASVATAGVALGGLAIMAKILFGGR